MGRVVIDPVTRVGAHLRIEAQVDGGAVTNAWSAGTMFRGIERILEGRDPRDAWLLAQRICGTCTGVHALASVRAVERALEIVVPRNARLVRNLLTGMGLVEDHVVGFYHRQALDWADLHAALEADPAAAARIEQARSEWPISSPIHYAAVHDRLATLAASGQAGLFAGGWWGHPAFRLAPEEDLVLAAHYLAALDWQRSMSRFTALLGGKNPHPQTFLVGGMALAPVWGGPIRPGEHPRQVDGRSPVALSARGLAELGRLVTDARAFVDQVFVPDVLALARVYPEWGRTGRGPGNYLAFGELPEADGGGAGRFLPAGRIGAGDLAVVGEVDPGAITESVARAHYDDAAASAGSAGPPAVVGQAKAPVPTPRYQGPPLPYETLDGAEHYSWLKAPRHAGAPMEVGPLARMLVGAAQGRDEVREALATAVSEVGMEPAALSSTLGRLVARAVEARVVIERVAGWLDELGDSLAGGDLAVANLVRWDPTTWPREAEGFALGEGPKGAVGHWVAIRDGRIARYQIVDASTWNASPRDERNTRGPLEEALVGTPVADAERPLEILRTVHSFDPCPACAVHAFGPERGGGAVRLAIRSGREERR